MIKKCIFVVVILMVNFCMAQTLYNGIGHIKSSTGQDRQEDWHNAGLDLSNIGAGQKIDVTQQPGTLKEQVRAAIVLARQVADSGNLGIVYFPEGSYIFNDMHIDNPFRLSYPDSNIVFLGDGADKTILHFTTNYYSNNYNCFEIIGNSGAYDDLDSPQAINKGNTKIYGDFSGIDEKDWIHFTEYYFQYNHDVPTSSPEFEGGIVGQVTKITDINGSSSEATIADKATKDYSSTKTLKVRKINPVKKIGIENLKIKRYPSQKATGYTGGENIRFAFAVNCWIKGVESENTARHHVSVSNSSRLKVSGCYFHQAVDYGGGGYGYGVALAQSTTNCLVENNIFQQLRHAMVNGAGANCNVWTYNYSRNQYSTKEVAGVTVDYEDRDLDLHAKYPYGNLFEHNYACAAEADDYHGLNGRYNTFVRNFLNDDQESEQGWINFENSPYYNVLGNMVLNNQQTLAPAPIGYDNDNDSGNRFDAYGYYVNVKEAHALVRTQHPEHTSLDFLDDISYYYSAPPEFISGFSWPSIGPRLSSGFIESISQDIPARQRYFSGDMTYNRYPTTGVTTNGTLSEDENWQGVVHITGHITVPSGVTLTILPGTIVLFDGDYRIIANAGSEFYANGAKFQSANNPATDWQYIKLYTDDAVIENCEIEGADYGVFVYNSDGIIKDCKISDCGYGIRAYHADAQPHIEGNDLTENDRALWIQYADPEVIDNKMVSTL